MCGVAVVPNKAVKVLDRLRPQLSRRGIVVAVELINEKDVYLVDQQDFVIHFAIVLLTLPCVCDLSVLNELVAASPQLDLIVVSVTLGELIECAIFDTTLNIQR